MYVKIQPATNETQNNASYVFECNHYSVSRIKSNENIAVRDDHIGLYWKINSEDGEPAEQTPFTKELWLYGKSTIQILLYNAIVYTMNDAGKTIDTIYA